jgi:hypothetical protein
VTLAHARVVKKWKALLSDRVVRHYALRGRIGV